MQCVACQRVGYRVDATERFFGRDHLVRHFEALGRVGMSTLMIQDLEWGGPGLPIDSIVRLFDVDGDDAGTEERIIGVVAQVGRLEGMAGQQPLEVGRAEAALAETRPMLFHTTRFLLIDGD